MSSEDAQEPKGRMLRLRVKKAAANPRCPITAYDVALLAGVSQSAVSRAFTPGASISESTRQKVEKAAAALNYSPNLIARSLSTSRSNMVGVIVPPLENQFYPTLLEALSEAFGVTGRKILLFTTKPGTPVDPILDDILHTGVDALVMIATSVSSRFAEQCQQIGMPVVLLCRKTHSTTVSSVTCGNRAGAETIADFLVAGGHKRIAYLAGLEASSTNNDRESAFTARLAVHGQQLAGRAVGNYAFGRASQAARELLSGDVRPDAVFCANDHTAVAFIKVARAEFGLEIGKDISVVGFDDSDLASWPVFDLTTFSQPIGQMAMRLAQVVDQQMQGDNEHAEQIIIQGEMIVRSSARLPPSGLSNVGGRQVWTPAIDNGG